MKEGKLNESTFSYILLWFLVLLRIKSLEDGLLDYWIGNNSHQVTRFIYKKSLKDYIQIINYV